MVANRHCGRTPIEANALSRLAASAPPATWISEKPSARACSATRALTTSSGRERSRARPAAASSSSSRDNSAPLVALRTTRGADSHSCTNAAGRGGRRTRRYTGTGQGSAPRRASSSAMCWRPPGASQMAMRWPAGAASAATASTPSLSSEPRAISASSPAAARAAAVPRPTAISGAVVLASKGQCFSAARTAARLTSTWAAAAEAPASRSASAGVSGALRVYCRGITSTA